MKLAVVLLTYSAAPSSPRTKYADITMRSLVKNLQYSDGEIMYHIADDGSYEGHVRHLKNLAKDYQVSTTNSERGGYGRSYNLATQYLHNRCDFLLMVEDDWQLTREFDVSPLLLALQDPDLNCIRLGYIGWTQELKGTIRAFADHTFLLFDPDSPEPHVWTGHPRLETVEFQRRVGQWPEGIDAGSTEFAISKRDSSRYGIAWPLDIAIRAGQVHGTLFAHIGEVQARTDQILI